MNDEETQPLGAVPARPGFPNPAQDAAVKPLDLHDLLIKRPSSTFYMRVDGFSMQDMGIHSNDLIIVDRSLEMQPNDIIVAFTDGEFVLRQFVKRGQQGYLTTARRSSTPVKVGEDNDFVVWGVVTYTVHSNRGDT